MSAPSSVAVVGASLAGLRACESLRTSGFTGRITLVGAEPEVPYDRPPLSKKYLAGEWEADRIRLRKAEEFDRLELDLRLGVPASGLDGTHRRVHLADGSVVDADAVVVATGASPRLLPGQPALDGVTALRTLADATALRSWLHAEPRPRVVVIGAGFIGLEVAATARALGCDVTVLEGAPAPLIRGLGPEIGAAVAQVHVRHGVALRCGVRVAGLVGDAGRVTGVRVAAGEAQPDETVPADVVVVGIGVAPAVAWLEGSGVVLDDGVVCDATLWTGVPGVYAAGDCARWHHTLFDPHDDAVMRVEHWTNAAEQGAAAVASLLADAAGAERPVYAGVPFVWSDQFDSRIQMVGRPHGGDVVEVIAGDPASGRCAVLYGWEGRLRAVLGVSMPKLVMPFRALLAARAGWDEALDRARELTATIS